MRRGRSTCYLSLVLLLGMPLRGRAADEQVAGAFQEANALYATAQRLANEQKPGEAAAAFQQAAQLYEQMLAAGFVSWPILYNLGNAQYRLGRIGKAIVNYRRAERLCPRNAEVKANIRQARQLTRDRHASRDMPSFFRSLLFPYYGLSVNEATLLAAAFYFAFCLSEILYIFLRRPSLKRSTIVLLVITILLSSSLALKIRRELQTPAGVVTAETCPVRIGPGEEYSVLFKAHEGADIVVLGERSDAHSNRHWFRVKVLIETEERTEAESRRVIGPQGYVLSSAVELL